MSFSLHVLSLGKRDKIEIPEYSTIYVSDESKEYDARYSNIYQFMTMQEGQWFSIDKEPFPYDIIDIPRVCDIDYEKAESGQRKYPEWIDNEDTIYDLYPLLIYDYVFEDFEHLLRYMLDQSPLSKIMFLARVQGTYEEIVCGTIPIDKFISKLKNTEVQFNICYIISKDSTIPDYVPSKDDEFGEDDFRPFNGRFYFRD